MTARKRSTRATGSRSKSAPSRIRPPRRGRKPPAWSGKSMAMLVRFDGNRPPILKLARGTIRPPQRELRPMRLGINNLGEVPPSTGEVIAALYDARRRPLAVYAWSSRPRYFGDVIVDEKTGALGGGMVPPRFDDRLLHLPIPRNAAYLLFARTRVDAVGPAGKHTLPADALVTDGEFGRVRLAVEALGLYRLGKPPLPPLPPFPPTGFPLPIFGLLKAFLLFVEHLLDLPELGWDDPPLLANGWIDSQETIQNRGDPATHFNIVITGDGFEHCEMQKFDQRARYVADKLMSMPPFEALRDQINIHLIRAVSHSSGVYRCGAVGSCEPSYAWPLKQTYYEVEGCWPPCGGGSSYPGYLGIPDPGRVYRAAEDFAPADQIQLFIVLVNAPVYGGSAFHEQRIAFVPLHEVWLAQLAAHESAHVIGDIVEEYTGKIAWDGYTEHANEVSRGNRDQVWWKGLTTTEERTSAGGFAHIIDCQGPSNCDIRYNKKTLSPSEDPGWLGLFWGAQFLPKDTNVDNLEWTNEDRYTNCLGKDFFRGQARCCMRSLSWLFCRVCAEEMRKIILNPSL